MSHDEEMTDAAGGADLNGAAEFVHEKQRLKLVRHREGKGRNIFV